MSVNETPVGVSDLSETGAGSVQDLISAGIHSHSAGNYTEAQRLYTEVLKVDPNHPVALHYLGVIAYQVGRHDIAVEMIKNVLEIQPTYAEAHNSLGNVFNGLGDVDAALASYQRALTEKPGYADAQYNIGKVWFEQDNIEKAAVSFRNTLKINPDYADAHNALGAIYRSQGREEDAMACFQKALAINPDHVDGHTNLAEHYLKKDDYERGWLEYEWGLKPGGTREQIRHLPCPVWQGEALEDKVIFIHAEQGVGDEVLFASCLDDLLALSPKQIFLECDPRLEALFRRSFPSIHVCGKIRADSPLHKSGFGEPDFMDRSWMGEGSHLDFALSIGSLPRYFRKDVNAFPRQDSFLIPDEQKTAQVKADYERRWPGKKRIGLSWHSGNKTEGAARSVALEQLLPVLRQSDCQFINLQYGEVASELEAFRHKTGVDIFVAPSIDPLRDLDGFSAQMAALDLVVTIDNSTAHIAGALGLPTWVLLSHNPNWRWSLIGSSSLWYASVSLYHQRVQHDWSDVVRRVLEDLQKRGAKSQLSERAELPSETVSIQKKIDIALKHLVAGDVSAAQDTYEDVLKADPDHPVALHYLGVIFHQTGNSDEGVKLVKKAIAIKPDYAEAHNNLGSLLTAQNKLDEAAESYQRALAVMPEYADALFNLGNTRLKQNKPSEAVESYRKTLRAKPDYVQAAFNLANIFRDQKKYQEAVAEYENTLAIKPDYAEAHFNLGMALNELGKHDSAAVCFEKTLQLHPKSVEAMFVLGNTYKELGKTDEALDCYENVLAIRPTDVEVNYNIGVTLQELGRTDEAIQYYQKALEIDPEYVAALNNLAIAEMSRENWEAALAFSQKAIARKPDFAEAHNNCGKVLTNLGRPIEAEKYYEKAIQIKPDYPDAIFNLGATFYELGDLEKAILTYKKAIEVDASYGDIFINMGTTFQELRKIDEAFESYAAALSLNPDDMKARWNLASLCLLVGDYQRGWENYEIGLKFKGVRGQRYELPEPIWRGENLAGKRILVLAEQGLGDEIQFASCLSDVLAQSPEQVFVECDPRLVPLFKRSFPEVRIHGRDRNRNETENPQGVRLGDLDYSWVGDQVHPDYFVAVGSLPKYFRNKVEDFPDRTSFLSADEMTASRIRSGYEKRWPGKKLIGISWSSNNRKDGGIRSLTLEQMMPVLCQSDCQFINLQYGDVGPMLDSFQQASGIHIFNDETIDPLLEIDSFAAQISALDLVITIDNSTAHISGALGVPTWVALPFGSNWRWLLEGTGSPWYSSLRLYRQPLRGDWTHVVKQLRSDLEGNGDDPRHSTIAEASPLSLERVLNDAALKLRAGDLAAAQEMYQKVLDADPDHPTALLYLGVIAHQVGRNDLALDLITEALDIRPEYPEALNNLGTVQKALGRLDEALASYQTALLIAPDYADACFNQGVTYESMKKTDEALSSYHKVIAMQPDYVKAHWNCAAIYLKHGDFERGWDKYEWGLKLDEERGPMRDLPCPMWRGEDLAGRSIFIYGEQGIGDEVMFASCLEDLLGCHPKHVFLECEPRLEPVFKRSFPNVQVSGKVRMTNPLLTDEESLPDYMDTSWMGEAPQPDFALSIGSLPKFFRRELKDFPRRDSFIFAYDALVSEIRAEYQARWPGKRLVGVSWRSGNEREGAVRSLTLEKLHPVLSRADCQFINLQYGDVADELDAFHKSAGINLYDDGSVDPLRDLDRFSAQVAALDLVTTIDNSTAHFAGALGVPSCVLLPFEPNWRWSLSEAKSLWYSRPVLFRQARPGAWEEAVEQVAKEIGRIA